jgi:hypothetical protein
VAKRATTTTFEDIAAEVGRLFGTTEAHARRWLDQRNRLVDALHQVRERANELIGDLSGETKRQMKRRARAAAVKTQIPPGNPAETGQGRKKRRLSAATRAKMRAAAKRRWAARKKSAAK